MKKTSLTPPSEKDLQLKKLEQDIINKTEQGEFVDQDFVYFLSQVMSDLNYEERLVANMVTIFSGQNAIKSLPEKDREVLLGLVNKFSQKGVCCFCNCGFSWRDFPFVAHVMMRPHGARPHHRRCYPKA